MQKQFNFYTIKWFIPNSFLDNPYLLRKSIVITYVHFLLAIVCLFATFFSNENQVIPLIPGFFCVMLLLVIFKKYGNLIISGNLLSLLFFIVLAPIVPTTGGLFSDNLLWLCIIPLIALLFANKTSGLIWFSVLIVFTFLMYLICNKNSNQFTFFNNIYYYFQSYTFFFITIFVVVIIFEKGQDLIIKMLQQQKIILENQKEILEEQKNLLELQKIEILEKNAELEVTQTKLIHKNGELENFASAASHDLKEPLRMIGMYTGLSKKRMVTLQDKPTIEYMTYVTDGVDRMQRLLDDLLQYSRTGKKQEDNKEIDLNAVLFVVISNLVATMKDTHATIVINELPTIEGSTTEMIQLFQNLIANAIKFRKADVIPEIKITASDEGDNYLISLDDNGIGIKKEFHEKVFAIFERLHSRNEFEGSGIGLATCKKIVAGAGGKIWLNSTEGVGTTFYFTFPKPSVN